MSETSDAQPATRVVTQPATRPPRGAVPRTSTLAPALVVLVVVLPPLACVPAEAPPMEAAALTSLVQQESRFFEVMSGARPDGEESGAAEADADLRAEADASHRAEADAGDRAEADAGDRAEALSAFFTPDAVLHVAGMAPVEGADAIHTFYMNLFRFLQASRPTPERAEVAESGDLAFTLGGTTNVFAGPEGPQEYRGKYAMVWRQVEGEWRVVLYSVIGDAP